MLICQRLYTRLRYFRNLVHIANMNWWKDTEWVIHILIPLLLIEKNQKTFFDFWDVGEVRKAAIFYLRSREKVVVNPEPNEAIYKTALFHKSSTHGQYELIRRHRMSHLHINIITANGKKLKNIFFIFGRLVRCERLLFFVCGAVSKLW